MSVTKKPAPSSAKDGMKVPPIIAAKMQTPSQTTTQTSLPEGVTVEAPLKKNTISEHVSEKYGSDTTPYTKNLSAIDTRVLGGVGFTTGDLSGVQKEAQRLKDLKVKREGEKSITENRSSNPLENSVEFKTSRDMLGHGVRMDGILRDIYETADKRGIKTNDQFRANFNELLKTANPEDVAFINKYGGRQYEKPGQRGFVDLDRLPTAAAEQYTRFIGERDAAHAAKEAKRPPVATVTDNMKASYKDMPAYTKAQAPGSIGMLDNANKTPVKLSVKKK
jgi:hypothetical protein